MGLALFALQKLLNVAFVSNGHQIRAVNPYEEAFKREIRSVKESSEQGIVSPPIG